jgi:hypothetical protein
LKQANDASGEIGDDCGCCIADYPGNSFVQAGQVAVDTAIAAVNSQVAAYLVSVEVL